MKGLAAAGFALLLTACSNSTACHLVGCASQASLRLPDLSPSLPYPLTAHGCFDDRCADVVIPQQPPAPQDEKVLPCGGSGRHACADLRSTQGYVEIVFPDPPEGTQEHTASVIVRDANGTVLIWSTQRLQMEKLEPNGERCGPICWQGAANFR